MSKIVVLGGGESGMGAALLAKSKGFEVFLSDSGPLKDQFQRLLTENQIQFEANHHSFDQILAASEVIISPGISENKEIVQALKAKGIPIVSEIEFAARYTSAKLIAITGSNGKTTTTLLIYHLLKEAGYQVGLAGNIGQSFAKQVMEDQHKYYVLEISSFQLDRCYAFSPDVSVLLNITPDHLDRYAYKFENYIHAKFKIFQNANPKTTCIYWEDDEVIKQYGLLIPELNRKTISFKNKLADAFITADTIKIKDQLIDLQTAPIKGPHNAINLSAALLAAQAVEITLEESKQILHTFMNAPHRLEACGEINEVLFINDSKATNVDAVFYALNSFPQPLILIMGGVDKGNEYQVLDALFKEKVKGLICLGKDNSKLISHFSGICGSIFSTDQLSEAVQKSIEWSEAGDVILLSPACASFDLFKNYEDRGNQFKATVQTFAHGK